MRDVRYFVKLMICTDEKFFGPGIVELLYGVKETHSLSKASRRMSLAYTKAHKMIRTAEAALGFKLTQPKIGGEGGGGSELTEKAVLAVAAYEKFENKVKDAAQDGFSEYLEEIDGLG